MIAVTASARTADGLRRFLPMFIMPVRYSRESVGNLMQNAVSRLLHEVQFHKGTAQSDGLANPMAAAVPEDSTIKLEQPIV